MGLLRKRTIILVMFVAFSMGLLIYSSFAYFGIRIVGTDNAKEVTIKNDANIKLNYLDDGYINIMSPLNADKVYTKKILITNTSSTNEMLLGVELLSVINKYAQLDKLTYTIDCQVYTNYDNGTLSDKTCDLASGIMPTSNSTIYNVNISPSKAVLITLIIKSAADYTPSNDERFNGYINVVKAQGENVSVNLEKGMIPVGYAGTKTVKADKTNAENSWYDYDNQKWANMVLVTENKRNAYETAEIGTEILEDDILGYFVWTPRYKYLLWDQESINPEEQEITIEFENKLTPKSTGSTSGEWLTHPAFTFGEEELSGIWVGKFELSADEESACYTSPSADNCNVKSGVIPRIVANADSWKYANVSTFFEISKLFKSNEVYGISDTSADSHMIKNSEWEAISYLSQSKYGSKNYKAESTTGNLYGIYDMSGKNAEYVMGNIVSESSELQLSLAGNFIEETLNAKYYDFYASKTFYANHSSFSNIANTWMLRGGKNSENTNIFFFSGATGDAGDSYASRVTLTAK